MALTLAARCATIGEAEAVRSALEAAGIETFVDNENIVAIDWLMSNAVGAIKVLVREEELEQASRILAEIPTAAPIDAEVEYFQAPPTISAPLACPECGSPDVQRVPRLRLFALFALTAIVIGYAVDQFDMAMAGVLALVLVMAFVPSHRCDGCGHRWSPSSDAARDEFDAPPPDAHDLVEKTCPRCGSTEVVRLRYRKLKTVPMLMSFTILFVAPIYLLLPKWQCEKCGLRT